MANLAGVLKEEIRRLARKEVRTEMSATRKAATRHRKDIAELKRMLRDQARQIAGLERQKKRAGKADAEDDSGAARFSPKWLMAHRQRLGISAADYAALVGVSPLTIYNWEKGKTRPRREQLLAWSAMRGLGKREAWKRLEDMG